jgi:hypothetical protein
MVQSTRKRLRACEPKRRTQLIWIDDPHATDADRERARQQAIADGWIKESERRHLRIVEGMTSARGRADWWFCVTNCSDAVGVGKFICQTAPAFRLLL